MYNIGIPRWSLVKNMPVNAGAAGYAFNPWTDEIPEEEKIATHSGILRIIPWTEQSGGLQTRSSQRVTHD